MCGFYTNWSVFRAYKQYPRRRTDNVVQNAALFVQLDHGGLGGTKLPLPELRTLLDEPVRSLAIRPQLQSAITRVVQEFGTALRYPTDHNAVRPSQEDLTGRRQVIYGPR